MRSGLYQIDDVWCLSKDS